MTFREWVDSKFEGSVKAAAKHLGLLHRTTYSYYANERWPRPNVCQLILLKSDHVIDLEVWQQAFSNNQNKSKKG